MFAHIARGYERFNHIETFWNDILWRFRALGELDRFRRHPVERALDLGAGTGEFARAVARRYPGARVVATDFTRTMLLVGSRANPPAPGTPGTEYAVADAHRLPFPDGTFDLVLNGFVARNLRDLGAAFVEWRRVLRPGGVALTLEVSEPASEAFGSLFHAYFDHVVPLLGRAARSEGPYRYLSESLKRFPNRQGVLELLASSGFVRAEARVQAGGAVTTFLAEAGSPTDRSR